jgi:hypothetical protein
MLNQRQLSRLRQKARHQQSQRRNDHRQNQTINHKSKNMLRRQNLRTHKKKEAPQAKL